MDSLIGKTLLLLTVAACTSLCGVSGVRCVGGDGGVPFSTIPNPKAQQWQPHSTFGSVEEIAYWEMNDTLLYRNTNGEVREKNIQNGSDLRELRGVVDPLSRVIDPLGRFFANDSHSSQLWSFDRKDHRLSTIEIPGSSRPVHQLFWNEHRLYSFTRDRREPFRLTFYESDRLTEKTVPVCSLSVPQSIIGLKPVVGSTYPMASFVGEQRAFLGKPTLVLISANLERCTVETMSNGGLALPAPLQKAYYFPKSAAYAVVFKGLARYVLWWGTTGCKYLDLGETQIVVPNPRVARFIGLSPKKELMVLNPLTATQSPIARGVLTHELSENAAWFTEDGKRLFIAPRLEGKHPHRIIEAAVSSNWD